MKPEQSCGYHAMRLLFQAAPHVREYYSRSFKQEQDLYLPKSGRYGEISILPGDLGKDARGKGDAWTPAVLMQEGRQAAIEAGENTDPATSFALAYTLPQRGILLILKV